MKSAYELAMERLNASDPSNTPALNDEQKEAIAEIGRKYQAKIAEREVFLRKQLETTRQEGDAAQEEQILKQLASEKAVLNEEMEAEKDKVRNA